LNASAGVAAGVAIASVALERYFMILDGTLLNARTISTAFTAVVASLAVGLVRAGGVSITIDPRDS
jgi:hypothetical protein